jgi:hypothetical protein
MLSVFTLLCTAKWMSAQPIEWFDKDHWSMQFHCSRRTIQSQCFYNLFYSIVFRVFSTFTTVATYKSLGHLRYLLVALLSFWRDNGGRNLNALVEPRTRPGAEGIGME